MDDYVAAGYASIWYGDVGLSPRCFTSKPVRANAPVKTDDGPIIWAPATDVGDQMEFLTPGFGFVQTWLL